MSNVVNPFAGKVRDAAVFENGKYLSSDGSFVLEIERAVVKDTRKNKRLYIVEMRVITSNKVEDPAGSKRSWCQDMGADGAFGEIKKFVYACLGLEFSRDKEKIQKEVDPQIEDLLGASIGTENPLRGVKLRCDTVGKKTKIKQTDFTQHNFGPYVAPAA